MGNPFLKMKELIIQQQSEIKPNIPFTGGGIGYVGYDIVRQFEEIGSELPDSIGMPDIHLLFYEVFIVFDHLEQKVYLV